jgi:hypothetical protein
MSLQISSQRNFVAAERRLDPSITSFIKPFSRRGYGTLGAFVAMVKRNVHSDVISPQTFEPRLDQPAIFEFDRSNLVIQLRTLQHTIDESAEELEMVAVERVFAKALSRTLTRKARKLHLLAEDLDGLLHQVEQAGGPKAPGRSGPKPKPRNRRNKRS